MSQGKIGQWLRILRIAGDLGVAHIEAQAVLMMNGPQPLDTKACIMMATRLQREIVERQEKLRELSPTSRRESHGSDLPDGQDVTLAWRHGSDSQDAVAAELHRLSRLEDQLRELVETLSRKSN